MKSLLMVIVSIVLLIGQTGSSWGAGRVAGSQYCVAIDDTTKANEELAQHFDSFARNADLEIDASHPLMRVYYLPGAGVTYPTDSGVMIALNKMGPLGSILSYHVLQEETAPLGLLDQLKRFVSDEVSNTYGTTLCEDINGFSAPKTYY